MLVYRNFSGQMTSQEVAYTFWRSLWVEIVEHGYICPRNFLKLNQRAGSNSHASFCFLTLGVLAQT